MIKPEGERIATLEVRMQDLIAKVDDISSDIKEIKKVISRDYTNREVVQTRLDNLEKTTRMWRWLSPLLAAVGGSVVTFLVIEYLKTH